MFAQIFEDLVKTQPSALVFIHYMRFIRRRENAAAARAVFKRARNSQACSWQVSGRIAMWLGAVSQAYEALQCG
jgi:hypothetical protein